ncbi:hypothetical protein LSH36_55g07001 [Paralvinella palmiformis]|uniref:mRNA export factor GLE1 n=1 Tax=Paralvinella palmiformis TaxID=53620 RepID=A0AAD9K5F2_9ANNE|nr:hypothetical protein LSH36_55g07001 [Paralvinella palmiformis]
MEAPSSVYMLFHFAIASCRYVESLAIGIAGTHSQLCVADYNYRTPNDVDGKRLALIKKLGCRKTTSPGLDCSDFDKQLIALHKLKQVEDADMRDMALRNSEGHSKRIERYSQMVAQRTEDHWHHLCKKRDQEIKLFAEQKEQELKHMQVTQFCCGFFAALSRYFVDHCCVGSLTEAQNEEQIAKLQQAHQEIMEAKAQYQEYIHQCDNGQPINVSAIDQLEIISNLSQQVEGMLSAVQSRPALSWDVKQLTSCVSKARDIVESVKQHVEMCQYREVLEEKKYREKLAQQQQQEQKHKYSENQQQQQEHSLNEKQQQKQPQQHQQQRSGVLPETQQQSGSHPVIQQQQQQQESQKADHIQKTNDNKSENEQYAQTQSQQQQQPQQQQQSGIQQMKVSQTDEVKQINVQEGDAESTVSAVYEAPKIVLNSVFRNTYKHYMKLISLQKENSKQFQTLLFDPKLKKSKFELQKAVNTLVNTISSGSGHQLCEKLNQIKALLSGSRVVVGSSSVSAKSCSGGLEFCRDLFAKKLVSQGETQVASQPESAFVFAAVAVGVWSEFPEVGDLILAHFYLACPYLVPYYVPQLEGQSTEQLLGYVYENDKCEKQDQFLKRMSGLMYFYAAITVSTPPTIKQHHPYGIDKAWSWLTQVIHLDPRPDITATLIFEFFEVTAYFLMQAYKKQFNKLLDVIIKEYLPKVRTARDGCSGGPVVRLESYLEKLRHGHATRPHGYPDQYFWLS